MKKVLILAIALFVASMAWAQSDTLLGPHNLGDQMGCKSCHAPHNGAIGNGGTSGATGEIYLWGRDFKTGTYNTFGGKSFSLATTPGEKDPVVHTMLCLSCHDNGISGTTMGATVGTNAQVANGGDLTNDHPVDAEYKPSTPTSAYNWNISITGDATNGYRVSFVDTSFAAGHPARLYPTADGTKAYVECSTCHNPHSQKRAVFKIAGAYATKTSSKFVRGWYDPADGSSQANFCRSCHLSKSDQYDGSVK